MGGSLRIPNFDFATPLFSLYKIFSYNFRDCFQYSITEMCGAPTLRFRFCFAVFSRYFINRIFNLFFCNLKIYFNFLTILKANFETQFFESFEFFFAIILSMLQCMRGYSGGNFAGSCGTQKFSHRAQMFPHSTQKFLGIAHKYYFLLCLVYILIESTRRDFRGIMNETRYAQM